MPSLDYRPNAEFGTNISQRHDFAASIALLARQVELHACMFQPPGTGISLILVFEDS